MPYVCRRCRTYTNNVVFVCPQCNGNMDFEAAISAGMVREGYRLYEEAGQRGMPEGSSYATNTTINSDDVQPSENMTYSQRPVRAEPNGTEDYFAASSSWNNNSDTVRRPVGAISENYDTYETERNQAASSANHSARPMPVYTVMPNPEETNIQPIRARRHIIREFVGSITDRGIRRIIGITLFSALVILILLNFNKILNYILSGIEALLPSLLFLILILYAFYRIIFPNGLHRRR